MIEGADAALKRRSSTVLRAFESLLIVHGDRSGHGVRGEHRAW
jgi:hypothetical protein